MPVWGQFILGAAAVVMAAGVLWTKVLRPGAKLIATADELLPMLAELTSQLSGTPNAFSILKEIVAEFRTDSGSSLRDVVNRLDDAAKENKVAAEVLKVQVSAAKLLATQDRAHLERMAVILDRLEARVALGASSNARIEATTEAVATELASAHERADAAEVEEP